MNAATHDHDLTPAVSARGPRLLLDSVKGEPGARPLIVEERKALNHYNDEAQKMAAAGRASGSRIYEIEASDSLGDPDEISAFIGTLRALAHHPKLLALFCAPRCDIGLPDGRSWTA